MAKQRLSAQEAAVEDSAPQRRKQPVEKRPGGSRLAWLVSRLLVVAVLLGVLVFCAPLAIGGLGLWKSLLPLAAPALAKQIDIAALQLSWFSPIEVRGLAVRDLAGQPLASVPLIRSRKTLLAIALNSRDVGTFDVQEPQVRIVLRADGSNVEDLLAKLPQSNSKPPSPGQAAASIGFGLALTKGVVQLDDQIAGRQWQMENLSIDVAWAAATNQPKTGKVAATVRPLAGNSAIGQLAVEFSWQPNTAASSPLGAGQAQITLQGISTEIAEGAMRRFATDIRPRGPLTLQAAGAWKDGGTFQLLVSQLATPGLSVAAPALLGTDQPTIAISAGQAAVQLDNGQLSVPNLQLASNLLSISGKGAAGAGGVAGGDVELSGQINLAELARQMPSTLHLKQDTQLASGVAEISLVSRSAADGRRWQGSLKTSDLRGVAAGRPIEFDQPLAIDFAIRQTAAGPIIDQLTGQASFLRLEGHGSIAEGQITANADLNRLVAELGRLIDWGQTQLTGTLATELHWKQEAATGWTANADMVVQNFQAISPGIAPWSEPNLHLAANVQGDLAGSSLAQINAATLLVEAGADRLDAGLIQPVKSPSAASVWPLKFTLRGDLASWAPRLQPFVSLGDWRMAGAVEASGSARVSTGESELAQTTVQISQLDINRLDPTGAGIAIREPIVKVETACAWSQSKATLTLGSTTFATSSLAFRADGVRVVTGKEPSITGQIDFRGDLGKLAGWMTSGPVPRTSQVAGGVTGRVEIGYRGQSLAATWTADMENLAYLVAPAAASPGARTSLASTPQGAAWQPLWQEPRVNFAGQGTFDPASGTLKIERTSLAAASGSLAAAGAVSKLTSSPEVDLAGEVAYDLGLVTQQLQSHVQRSLQPGASKLPYGLDTLQLAGKEKRQFVLKGPLFAATGSLTPPGAPSAASQPPAGFHISEALQGEASLGWQGAQYVGLVAGPADFKARLAGGVVQIGPLDIPLAEGRLKAAARVLLNDRVPAVVIDRGPLIENVRISPEMCGLWLKFVAPLVAEATRAEGTFSLSLEGANVPISMPLASDVAGTLAIQNAQIGPGPLAQQYLGMARQLLAFFEGGGGNATAADDSNRGWLVLPQQEVQFEVRDGVVHNRGLKMSVKNLVITTAGEVNIQTQQVNLLASIPLTESLFKKQDGIFASLKGQTLQIPITGALSQPRLDTRVLENLGKQLAGSAVQGLITKPLERGQGLLNKELQKGQGVLQGELGQGLNRLLGPRTTPPAPSAPR